MVDETETGAAAPRDAESLVPLLEALLFASPDPLGPVALKNVLGGESLGGEHAAEMVEEALSLLRERTAQEGRGILLAQVAGGWQFLTREEFFPFVKRIARTRAEERITPAGVETLSVIAYKQPVTRAEVDAVRGVASGPIIRTLMDRGMVRVTGRAELPEIPFHYGTTKQFLRHFGLRSTKELPEPQELSRMLADQAR